MPRRLSRDTRRAVVGGVAAGFGEYLDVDPVLVRVGFILLALVHGLGVLFYLACWFVMPQRGAVAAPASGSDPAAAEVRDPAEAGAVQLGVGFTLVIAGGLLLAHNLDWLRWPHWLRFDTLWPLLFVALGAGLILKSRRAVSA